MLDSPVRIGIGNGGWDNPGSELTLAREIERLFGRPELPAGSETGVKPLSEAETTPQRGG